jgi:hypothetical protein
MASADVPVRAGQLLGHQGRWNEQSSQPVWVHLCLSVMRAAEDGLFPEEIAPENVLDPSPYLGIVPNTAQRSTALRCKEIGP